VLQRKEVTAMQKLKSKKLMLLLIGLASIFVFGLTGSLAQEKTKVAGKIIIVNTKYEVIKLEDVEGHTLIQHGWKGVDTVEGTLVFVNGLSDYIKRNGIHRGYSKFVHPNGDLTFNKFEGKTTTTLSPAGKPLVTIEGNMTFTRGTGKFENIQGDGTYKGKAIGPGILSYEWQAEYIIKK
jgi:hypothetical protein